MRPVLVFGLLVTLGYGALVLALYAGQRWLLFPASPDRATAAEAGLASFSDVAIATADGERLLAWWRPPEPGRAVLLYFHGNGGSLLNRRDRVRALTADGRGAPLVSYRGYSGSTGSPSESGLTLDAEAAYRFLASYEPRRIVLYGESLGSGVAVRLASERPVGAVILDAPFTSVTDVARSAYWFVPVDWLLRDRFASLHRIASIRAPLLILHGERDSIVPIALAARLFEAAREPKRFVRLAGVDHVSVLERGGLAEVRRSLDEVEARLAETDAPRGGDMLEGPCSVAAGVACGSDGRSP